MATLSGNRTDHFKIVESRIVTIRIGFSRQREPKALVELYSAIVVTRYDQLQNDCALRARPIDDGVEQ